MSTLLAGVAGACVVAGLVGVVVGLRPVRPVPGVPGGRRPRRRVNLIEQLGPRPRLSLAIGAVAGVLVWLGTGYVVALVAVPAAAIGLPMLLQNPSGRLEIARLDALAEWTRSLSGVLGGGQGLEQAVLATRRSAPAAIEREVASLAARLNARWPLREALDRFGEDLDDATGDRVVAGLQQGAATRGPGLATLLRDLAADIALDVSNRRQIEAARARPRATARWITLITVGVLVLVGLNGDYLAPYRTPLGQLVLIALLAAFAATLFWLRRLTTGRPPSRVLRSAERPT